MQSILLKQHFSFINKSNINFYMKNPYLKGLANNPCTGRIILFPKLFKEWLGIHYWVMLLVWHMCVLDAIPVPFNASAIHRIQFVVSRILISPLRHHLILYLYIKGIGGCSINKRQTNAFFYQEVTERVRWEKSLK